MTLPRCFVRMLTFTKEGKFYLIHRKWITHSVRGVTIWNINQHITLELWMRRSQRWPDINIHCISLLHFNLTFIMLQNIFISNKYHGFHKIIKQHMFSTSTIIRNAYWMISEDHVTLCSNDAENSSLHRRNKSHLTIYPHRKHLFEMIIIFHNNTVCLGEHLFPSILFMTEGTVCYT